MVWFLFLLVIKFLKSQISMKFTEVLHGVLLLPSSSALLSFYTFLRGSYTFGFGTMLTWDLGAGTFSGLTGARQPTPLELGVARSQGKLFASYVQKNN